MGMNPMKDPGYLDTISWIQSFSPLSMSPIQIVQHPEEEVGYHDHVVLGPQKWAVGPEVVYCQGVTRLHRHTLTSINNN